LMRYADTSGSAEDNLRCSCRGRWRFRQPARQSPERRPDRKAQDHGHNPIGCPRSSARIRRTASGGKVSGGSPTTGSPRRRRGASSGRGGAALRRASPRGRRAPSSGCFVRLAERRRSPRSDPRRHGRVAGPGLRVGHHGRFPAQSRSAPSPVAYGARRNRSGPPLCSHRHGGVSRLDAEGCGGR
jgi:hypothetical protein